MSWSTLGTTFVTMLVIMDPLGAAPIFVTLTRALEPRRRRAAAVRAAAAAGAVVVLFALAGDAILRYLDVSIHSVSIAGGLLLLLLSLEMLRGIDFDESPEGDVALVPLASPLVAGPGAIATAMVLARQHASAGGRIAVVAGILAAVVVIGATLAAADALTRRVPPAAVHFVTRVFGLLLAALGVELVLRGVHGAFPR